MTNITSRAAEEVEGLASSNIKHTSTHFHEYSIFISDTFVNQQSGFSSLLCWLKIRKVITWKKKTNVQGYLFVLKHKFIKNWKQQLKQQLQKNKMNIETIISGKQKVTENKKKLSEKQKNKHIKLSNFNQTSFNAHQATWLLVHLSQ